MTESPDFVRNQDFFCTFSSNILLAVFLTQTLFRSKRQTYPRIKRLPTQGAFAHRDGGLLFMSHIPSVDKGKHAFQRPK